MIAGLVRRVKRALQDDQNDILDRLRSQGGWKDGVLPELPEHTTRYVRASEEMLAEAARAGSTYAGVTIERAVDVDAEAFRARELAGRSSSSPPRRRLSYGRSHGRRCSRRARRVLRFVSGEVNAPKGSPETMRPPHFRHRHWWGSVVATDNSLDSRRRGRILRRL